VTRAPARLWFWRLLHGHGGISVDIKISESSNKVILIIPMFIYIIYTYTAYYRLVSMSP